MRQQPVFKLTKSRRPRSEIDFPAFGDEVCELMGRPVSVRMTDEQDGVSFTIADPESGLPIEYDSATLAQLLDDHVPPEPQLDPLDRLEIALSKATTILGLRSALTEYVVAEKLRRFPQNSTVE